MRIEAPYFHAKLVDGRVLVAGTARQTLARGAPDAAGTGADRGLFVEWSWDGSALTVRNDRFGLHPAYFYAGTGEIMISPSIPKLIELGAPTAFDETAIATFLAFSFLCGDDTPFARIRSLGPAATLRWSPDALDTTSDLKLVPTQSIARAAAIDGYIERFRIAVARRTAKGKVAVPLSAGRDSRHLLFELCRAGRQPAYCITSHQYPPTASDDVAIAAQLTARLGVPHVVVQPPHARFDEDMASLYRCNFGDTVASQWNSVLRHCTATVQTVFDGLGGDFLSAGAQLSRDRIKLLDAGKLDELARTFLPSSGPLRATLLAAGARKSLRSELAVARLTDELKLHLGAGNPLTSFMFYNRCRRRIALNPLANYAAIDTLHMPYLDYDVVDFLLSLPVEVVVDRTFHTDTIAAAFPEYSDIPFEREWRSRNEPAHFSRFARDALADLARHPRSAFLNVAPMIARFAACAMMPALAYRVAWWADWTSYFRALDRVVRTAPR